MLVEEGGRKEAVQSARSHFLRRETQRAGPLFSTHAQARTTHPHANPLLQACLEGGLCGSPFSKQAFDVACFGCFPLQIGSPLRPWRPWTSSASTHAGSNVWLIAPASAASLPHANTARPLVAPSSRARDACLTKLTPHALRVFCLPPSLSLFYSPPITSFFQFPTSEFFFSPHLYLHPSRELPLR